MSADELDPSEIEHELARLRREVMVARDALLGAEAEKAVLSARVVTLEGEVANLKASAEQINHLIQARPQVSGLRQRLRPGR